MMRTQATEKSFSVSYSATTLIIFISDSDQLVWRGSNFSTPRACYGREFQLQLQIVKSTIWKSTFAHMLYCMCSRPGDQQLPLVRLPSRPFQAKTNTSPSTQSQRGQGTRMMDTTTRSEGCKHTH
eukprot:gb/GEZJ01005955.1/.p3 GENE.gb/GEZJ01005955.1/~~gb/GEZJ01005955.1/.p3  ORF type:complete len:125 (-),score=2.00 gb/GEZJ01005955.1/:1418-1792(-)